MIANRFRLRDFYIKLLFCNDWYSKKISYYAIAGIRITTSSRFYRLEDYGYGEAAYIDHSVGGVFGGGINISLLYLETLIHFPAHVASKGFIINGGFRFKL